MPDVEGKSDMASGLRVNFVLHSIGTTGGVLVVLEYARRLRSLGHDVRVYYPAVPYRVYFEGLSRWKRPIARIFVVARTLLNARRRPDSLKDAGVRLVPLIRDAFVEDADFTIATAWPTAYDVASLKRTKGRKLYFVQHYETWNGRLGEVDASYRLPLDILTIAPWLTRLMGEKFGCEVAAELHNGIDLTRFRPPESRPDDPITILMLHHVLEIKGVPDGLDVLRRIKERHPGVRIRTFGMYPFPDAPPYIEHFRNPSPESLIRLYQEAHVFLSPSVSEGWHLPPMEAMACGCAVVATRVGCVPVLEAGGGLMVAEPGDRDSLFAHVDALITTPDLLRETARQGLVNMQAYDWGKMTQAFERVLKNLRVL